MHVCKCLPAPSNGWCAKSLRGCLRAPIAKGLFKQFLMCVDQMGWIWGRNVFPTRRKIFYKKNNFLLQKWNLCTFLNASFSVCFKLKENRCRIFPKVALEGLRDAPELNGQEQCAPFVWTGVFFWVSQDFWNPDNQLVKIPLFIGFQHHPRWLTLRFQPSRVWQDFWNGTLPRIDWFHRNQLLLWIRGHALLKNLGWWFSHYPFLLNPKWLILNYPDSEYMSDISLKHVDASTLLWPFRDEFYTTHVSFYRA